MAIKKLLKIFLFIFSIYFYYQNILKKHIICPWFTKQRNKKARTQNKKENTKEATNIQNKIEKGQL